ncbi:MAG TPA: cyclic nucleotide-binding domain-containing protein, partial [Candidatus Methylacidiphilales bacterium]|nr:cyclic nucleotide-binding domain-containing protein [Candidatus Methylacidiphilales bacterium]
SSTHPASRQPRRFPLGSGAMLFGLSHRSSPRLQLLKNVVLFKDLSMRDLAMVNSLLHERRYIADEVIFDEGEEGQGLFLVLSGRVKITLPANIDQVLIELGPGAFFGEVALLDSSIRTAQARALEDSQIVALFRTEFYSLLDTHSAIASRISFQLAKVLAARLRQAVLSTARPHHEAA